MGLLKLKVLLEAVDRISGPVRRVAGAIRTHLAPAAKVGGRALKSMAMAGASAVGVLAGLAATAGGALGFNVIKVGAKFEQFRAVLETLEGSAVKADQSMDWVSRFAKDTPYELDQVMEAFVALRSYGIDPTGRALRTLGDGASGMNKPLMQAIEMLADAQTGEFERLKEFGIRGSAAGNKVKLTYQKAGKEVTVTAKKSATAIREAVLDIFDSRFAGAMEKQSKTAKGLWSNLMDQLTAFERMVADAGVFNFLKGELQTLLNQVNAMAANGQLQAWAKEVSAKLVELLTALKNLVMGVNWVDFIKGVTDAANGFAAFMKFIGGFQGLITGGGLAAIGWLTASIASLGATIATALGVAIWPVTLTIAAIGAVIAIGWLLWRNWGVITKRLKELWDGFAKWCGEIWDRIVGAFKAGAERVWNVLPPWLQTFIKAHGFAIRVIGQGLGAAANKLTGGGGDRPRPAAGPAQRNGLDAGGRVQIDVRTDRPPAVKAQSNDPRVSYDVSQVRRGGWSPA